MNTENLEFLADRIKYSGFGDKQLEALEGHLKEGKEAFQMVYTAEINKKNFEATLNFRKSDSIDRYFFNGYTASLERKNGEKVQQYFYLDNGKGVKPKRHIIFWKAGLFTRILPIKRVNPTKHGYN